MTFRVNVDWHQKKQRFGHSLMLLWLADLMNVTGCRVNFKQRFIVTISIVQMQ